VELKDPPFTNQENLLEGSSKREQDILNHTLGFGAFFRQRFISPSWSGFV